MNCAAKSSVVPLALLTVVLALPASVLWAQEATVDGGLQAVEPPDQRTPSFREDRWVLGTTLSSAPTYSGGAATKLGFKPVLAARVGRFMVSSSNARAMAGMELAGGISTQLMEADRWTLGAGLRVTRGRSSSDDPVLSGMPSISSSLALRGVLGYALSPHWRATASVQHDLLHSQGTRVQFGVGWSKPVGAGWALNAGAGLTWASAQATSTFYGVEPPQAQPGRPAWQPGGGLESWAWSAGVSRVLSSNWRVSGQIGSGRLMGDAARSPLTRQRQSNTASVTLAYVGR